ncbi:hypothetical protein A2914_01000 [Candidatus Nomurabacteria bacterium RIFCSPLOWO2_01_FULL_41_21]|uniref:Capsule synthesis protein CapA domain-containing protein n=2 Tax=Candidatus Nomuraibacteriota TaxID=1752729 RepID=A0A1F6V231_9BACT|nr:MAG: hypothetical protein A2733_02090 [Candidatus Nomurabacteria bacterium RIFCSPHIGHO2_01_FULL_40_20]OGI87892.1 MAG: hypothetical protein A2914_01000 [Candidatus Nomurabacteria bacterium RIFCSPLOWO2_01_FULL_41_21]
MRNFWQKIKFGAFTLLAIVLGVFVTSFAFDHIENLAFQSKERAVADTLTLEELSNTPAEIKEETQKYFYFTKDEEAKPKVSAEAYIVGDLNTGEVIVAKNADQKFPIASVSKLMTALVSKELANEDDTAKVSASALSTYGENGGLHAGEKIKIKDLFYPLLLESSNDAAEILAEFFGREIFIRKLNQQSLKLKMNSTSFFDPSGLSRENQSTVSDLFKLSGHLYQNESELLSISKTKSYDNKKHIWFSINQFLHKKNYVGGKSGFTDPAGQTVISIFDMPLAEETTRPIGIVLLKSQDRVRDVENILNYLTKYVYYGGRTDATADWIAERLDIGDLREPDYARLSFLGDMMLDRGVRSSVAKNFAGNYSALFDNMEILKNSDIVFANLEGPASDKGEDQKNLYSFRMDPSVIPAIKGGGVSIVNVTNNHVGDWGREAYADTLARLKENEILYTGGGTKAQAEAPTIVEKNGLKIGYLGFSDVGPNGMVAREDEAGVLLANNPRFEEIIKSASEQVDFLVVSFHFGEEYKNTHNDRQEYLAHTAIDNGARIIVGHHPHVMQDTEVYKNGFIIYSLGNFIFDQRFSPETSKGTLYEIEVRQDGSMTEKKNIIETNRVFQPEKVIKGKEEVIKFTQ